MRRLLSAALGSFLLLSPLLLAHEGHVHKLMGTVVSVNLDSHQLEVKGSDGKTVMLTLSDKTKVSRGSRTSDTSEIAVGSRVVVKAIEENGAKVAVEVQLSKARKPAPKPK